MTRKMCKNCGAPLSYKGLVVKCEYCDTVYAGEDAGCVYIRGHKFYIAKIETQDVGGIRTYRDVTGSVSILPPITKSIITLVEA